VLKLRGACRYISVLFSNDVLHECQIHVPAVLFSAERSPKSVRVIYLQVIIIIIRRRNDKK
jgi:hypothetical protein